MASSSKTKPSTYNTNCCVFGCHSRKGADRNIHFHSFPEKSSGIRVKMTNNFGQVEEVDKRKAWEKVLLMGKPVTKYMRVCSKHFNTDDYRAKGVKMQRPKLNRHAVPSQNLPKKRSYAQPGPSHLPKERLPKRQKTNEAALSNTICETNMTKNLVNSEELGETVIPRTYNELSQDEKVVIDNLLSFGESDKKTFVKKEVQVSSGDIITTFVSTIKQDTHLNSLTGLNSFELLNTLSNLVQKNVIVKPIAAFDLSFN